MNDFLVQLANESETVRDYLGVKDWKNIVKVTPNSVHRFVCMKDDKPQFQAKFCHHGVSERNVISLFAQTNAFQSLDKKYGVTEKWMSPSLTPSLVKYLTTGDLNSNKTVTCYVSTTNNSWATIHNAVNGTASLTSSMYVYLYAYGAQSDTWSNLARAGVEWDTSSIGAGSNITSAEVDLYVKSGQFVDNANLNQGINLVSFSPAGETYVIADYSAFGSTDYATDIDMGSLSTDAYNTWTLNASGLSGITVDGDTKFGVRFTSDIDNIEPTWVANAYSKCYFDRAEDTNKPILNVTYTLPSTGFNGMMMGMIG